MIDEWEKEIEQKIGKENYKQAIELNPENSEAYHNYGLLLQNQGRK
ncbi:tetratricopeptide repeat protein [Peptostreptococcaceae bacterium OttesenSCG-928-C18]|nr:tetratricopeptide repeat protein [Peptostreptococcaceae bacterium OttesenSCG-928-C18]